MFVPAAQVLTFQGEVSFGDFLLKLRRHPERLAEWVVVGEKLHETSWKFANILHSLLTGLYGSCLLPEDTDSMLKFLQELAKLQIAKNEDPRR